MRLRLRSLRVPIAVLAALSLIVGAATIASGSVSTDQTDYPPGSVVTISGGNADGAGYVAGETVHVVVDGPSGFTTSCNGTADNTGAWSCQITVPADVSGIGGYSYTATGQTSGVAQSGTFTDSGCPNANALGNFVPSPDLSASFTTSSNTATYKFTSTNESPSGGVPGLIEYCVYTSPLPDSKTASFDSWQTGASQNGGYFDFERPDGNPSNAPFDGSTQTMGTATWSGGVPSGQTILLHINDAAECNALYGGNPGTCFVLPGGPQPTSAVTTTIHRVNGNGTETDVTNGSVIVGQTVHDHATVATTVNPIPTGSTVTFRRFAAQGCSGAPVATQTVAVPSGSTSATVQTSNLAITAAMVPGISFDASFVSGNTGSGGVPNAGPSACENLKIVPDTTPPSCTLTALLAGPPTQIKVTVQDAGSGLKSIVVTSAVNATVAIPSFTAGTTSPLVVTGTKVNQSQGSSIALRVTDLAGNVTNCDPVLSMLVGPTGKQAAVGVPTAEHVVTVTNGAPGLQVVTVSVNGKHFVVAPLRDGQQQSIDITSALRPGDSNIIELFGAGSPRASANVIVWDGNGHV